MGNGYKITDPESIYFITFAVVEWVECEVSFQNIYLPNRQTSNSSVIALNME